MWENDHIRPPLSQTSPVVSCQEIDAAGQGCLGRLSGLDEMPFEVFDGLAPLRGRHHFPSTSSLSAALSSSASARRRFSFAFSCSSARSRLASETSRPPYFDFQQKMPQRTTGGQVK